MKAIHLNWYGIQHIAKVKSLFTATDVSFDFIHVILYPEHTIPL